MRRSATPACSRTSSAAPTTRSPRRTSSRRIRRPGTRTDKGNPVTIVVSTGQPKVDVPGVVGDQATDAVASITELGLKADVHQINSDKETGTVTGQDPAAGTRVVKGTRVRINVSQGPKPIAVPPVVGVPYEQAAAQLQGAGFAVARRDVDSNDPRGTVVRQDPAANSLAAKGSTVTLYVSKGPTRVGRSRTSRASRASDAIATLRNSGFKVSWTERRPGSGPRRHRPLPDPRRRARRRARHDGDDHGRPLRAAAAATTTEPPTTTDHRHDHRRPRRRRPRPTRRPSRDRPPAGRGADGRALVASMRSRSRRRGR